MAAIVRMACKMVLAVVLVYLALIVTEGLRFPTTPYTNFQRCHDGYYISGRGDRTVYECADGKWVPYGVLHGKNIGGDR